MRSTPAFAALASMLLWLGGCHQPPTPPGDEPEFNYLRAVNAMTQNRADWARIYAQAQLLIKPDHADARRLLGMSWNSGYQQSLSEAIGAYQNYLQDHPDDDEIRTHLIRALHMLGEDASAQQHCARLTTAGAPADAAAAINTVPQSRLDALLLCFDVWLPTDPEQSAALLETATRIAPADAALLLARARLADGEGDAETALIRVDEALRIRPLDVGGHYLRARLLRTLGRTEEARLALEAHADAKLVASGEGEADAILLAVARLAAIASTPELELAGTRALLRAGRLAEATASAHRLLAPGSFNLSELLNLAVLADTLGARSLAGDLFRQVLDRDPDNIGARSSLALLALDAGDLELAESLVEAGRAARPEIARYLLIASRIAGRRDDSAQAINQLQQALNLAPWENSWRLELAQLLRATGQPEAAQSLMDAAPATPEQDS